MDAGPPPQRATVLTPRGAAEPGRASAGGEELLEQEVTKWLEEVTGRLRGPDELFAEWLKDGTILCEAVNGIQPNTIPKICGKSNISFKHMENISQFLRGAQALGVVKGDLFCAADLYEERNIRGVMLCINNLGWTARKTQPDFLGPWCGPPPNKKFLAFGETIPDKVVGATLEEECTKWLQYVVRERKPADKSFGDWLQDGQVLCRAANKLKPGSVEGVSESQEIFKRMENIGLFLKAVRSLGVLEKDLFCSQDLAEQKDLEAVQKSICCFGACVQISCPGYKGPTLGVPQRANSNMKRPSRMRTVLPGEARQRSFLSEEQAD